MAADEQRKEMIVVGELSASASPQMRQIDLDTHSLDAFEMLRLGEVISNLQADQRKMRLAAEDMRFERDRYKASAASFQDKLTEALNENARLRDLRDVMKTLAVQMDEAAQQQSSGDQLRLEMASLEDELEQSKARSEEMRHAFIGITRDLINEIQARSHNDAQHSH